MLIRYLGRSDYALFSLSTSVVTLLAFDLGLNSAVARFVATSEAAGDRARTVETLRAVRRVYAALDLVLLLALFVVWHWAGALFPGLTRRELGALQTCILVAGGIAFVSFPLQSANGTLQGLERFVALKMSDLAWRVASVIAVIGVVLLDLGLYVLVFLTGATSLAVSLYRAMVCVRSGTWRRIRGSISPALKREIAAYTSWSFVVALGQRLMITVMPAILAAQADSHAVSGFAIAAMLEGYVWLIANALNGLFLPRVARLLAADDHAGVQSLMEQVGRFQILLLGFVTSAFALFGRPLVHLWLGAGYDDVYLACLVLILPALVVQTQEVGMSALVARGEIRYRALCTAVAAATNVVLALNLVPRWGALGAAISVCAGAVVGYILCMNIMYVYVARLNVGSFFRHVHLKLLPVPAALSIAFLFALPLPPTQSLLRMMPTALCFAVMYAGGSWLALRPHERRWILGVLRLDRKVDES